MFDSKTEKEINELSTLSAATEVSTKKKPKSNSTRTICENELEKINTNTATNVKNRNEWTDSRTNGNETWSEEWKFSGCLTTTDRCVNNIIVVGHVSVRAMSRLRCVCILRSRVKNYHLKLPVAARINAEWSREISFLLTLFFPRRQRKKKTFLAVFFRTIFTVHVPFFSRSGACSLLFTSSICVATCQINVKWFFMCFFLFFVFASW